MIKKVISLIIAFTTMCLINIPIKAKADTIDDLGLNDARGMFSQYTDDVKNEINLKNDIVGFRNDIKYTYFQISMTNNTGKQITNLEIWYRTSTNKVIVDKLECSDIDPGISKQFTVGSQHDVQIISCFYTVANTDGTYTTTGLLPLEGLYTRNTK